MKLCSMQRGHTLMWNAANTLAGNLIDQRRQVGIYGCPQSLLSTNQYCVYHGDMLQIPLCSCSIIHVTGRAMTKEMDTNTIGFDRTGRWTYLLHFLVNSTRNFGNSGWHNWGKILFQWLPEVTEDRQLLYTNTVQKSCKPISNHARSGDWFAFFSQ